METGLVFSDNLEGWDGVGGAEEVQEGGHMCTPVAVDVGRNQHNIVNNYPPIKKKTTRPKN